MINPMHFVVNLPYQEVKSELLKLLPSYLNKETYLFKLGIFVVGSDSKQTFRDLVKFTKNYIKDNPNV